MKKTLVVVAGAACFIAAPNAAIAQDADASGGVSLSTSGASADGDASGSGDEGKGSLRPEAGLVELGLFGGVLLPAEKHNLHSEDKVHQPYKTVVPEFGLRLGYYPLAFLGIEGEGMGAPGQTDGGDSAFIYAGRLHLIGQLTGGKITPFILAGGSFMGVTSDALGDDFDPVFHFGLGAKIPFGRVVGLRLDVRDNLASQNRATDGMTHNFEGLLGLSLTFGRSEPAPPPPPDTDGDGLIDSQDRCPQEPAQTPDGCPVRDTDGDGVLDPADKCPTEPAQTPDGCPIRDTDGDGVLDPADKCPTVPAQTPDGCPITDVDGDGLLPPDDKCPDQPETTNGFEDTDGCPDTLPDAVKAFNGVVEGITFDTGKSTIRPASKPVLDQAVAVLKEYPSLRMQISGHTDNVGTPEKNQALSQARAEAVKQYLVDAGIDTARIETFGAGQDQPITENKTRDGRQKNRRIEFKVLQ